jgi:hypothetical protein
MILCLLSFDFLIDLRIINFKDKYFIIPNTPTKSKMIKDHNLLSLSIIMFNIFASTI